MTRCPRRSDGSPQEDANPRVRHALLQPHHACVRACVQEHEFVKSRLQRKRDLRRVCQAQAQKNQATGQQIRQLQEEVRGLDARIEERMQHLQVGTALFYSFVLRCVFSFFVYLRCCWYYLCTYNGASM